MCGHIDPPHMQGKIPLRRQNPDEVLILVGLTPPRLMIDVSDVQSPAPLVRSIDSEHGVKQSDGIRPSRDRDEEGRGRRQRRREYGIDE